MHFFADREKENIYLLGAVSALLAGTFFVFGPIQMYISNITELWFSIFDIIGMCVAAGVLAGLVVFSIGIVLKGQIQSVYICLLFGLSIALYLQGNFVLTNYGVLDGREIAWEEYTFTAVWNTLFWIVCLTAPLAVVHLQPEAAKKGFKWASLFLIAVQMLALVITLAAANLEKDSGVFISTKGLNEVSEEGNVIIFLLDTYDDQDVKELLETEPDIFSELDGFTYFENTTGMYPTTKGSLPFILTGEIYRNEQPYSDYVANAYTKTDYYRDLKNAGYDIGLYVSTLFLGINDCKDYVSNLTFSDVKVSSPLKMLGSLYKFTGFRYFPHVLKPFVWFYSGEFDEYKVAANSDLEVFNYGNMPYYNNLTQKGLTLAENEKCYRFIYLVGAHPPYTLTEDLREVDDGSATHMSAAKGSLKIVCEYIRQLKELGVYDQSTVVIMSDHGEGDLRPKNPILFVKRRNSSGPLQLTNAPVSQEDIQATIMSDLGMNENEKYGRSMFDIEEGEVRDRYFLYYTWDDSWSAEYLPIMYEYYILPDGNNIENLFMTGRMFGKDGIEDVDFGYVLGDDIIFTEESDGTRYFMCGMAYVETSAAWSHGYFGRMYLDFGDVRTDLTATIEFNAIYTEKQHIIIKSGGEVLYDDTVETENLTIGFYVPEHCLDDGKLELEFEYPDAKIPAEISDSQDIRRLAVMFYKIRFEASQNELR